MALGATLYLFAIELADSDRGLYQALELRVARHPSEAAEYLLTRVLAYCLEYDEGIAFSNGLADPDQPAIHIHDLTGALKAWIEVGTPDAARLHRAGKAAPRVVVYAHKDAQQLAERLAGERIHRVDELKLYGIDRGWLASLAERLTRRMTFTLTVSERHMYLSLGEETFSSVITDIPVRPR